MSSKAVPEKFSSPANGVGKFPIGQYSGVIGDHGTMEFKLETMVEVEPQRRRFRCTHGAPFVVPPNAVIYLIIIPESAAI